ncbi:MAG: ice-binding family protein [Hylemonella sp.]|nr:ice-binding family protein [Hylemonella sp.]
MKNFESYTRTRRWLVVSALAAVLAACGGGEGGRDPILGTGLPSAPSGIPGAPAGAILPGAVCTVGSGVTIPTVTTSNPSAGNQFVPTSTTSVAPGKQIMATFSLPMDAATINATTFTLTPLAGATLVPASVGYNASTRVATLTTSAALLPNTTYTAVITVGVLTATGAVPPSCSYAWTFKTVTPAASGLAAVNMGLATPFGISATAGLATAISSSTVSGDVMLDPLAQCNTTAVDGLGGIGSCGAIGFPPTINGSVISSLYNPGLNLAAIRADLNTAYLSLCPAGVPSAGCSLNGGIVIGAPSAGIGGGVGDPCVYNANAANCFTPGVYTAGSTITVTGDLTLDAQGDENAVFVFQAGSTVGTAAGAAPPGARARILLINGAKASNVWWVAGSSATVGTFGEFQGNIMAAISVTLNNGATSCGRMMAGAWVGGGGAITLGGANVVSVPGRAFAPPAGYSTTCQ